MANSFPLEFSSLFAILRAGYFAGHLIEKGTRTERRKKKKKQTKPTAFCAAKVIPNNLQQSSGSRKPTSKDKDRWELLLVGTLWNLFHR
ncbi:hypothetical protein GWI33_020720 [Rhynchophorus ferrugineus]|uniref:Uncharacterized protein n=1 Tax=Rhynchophorus ferrugineus TaxID=354439 RepID=A0A834HU24_RHYFE|nr:hypothetical protein GWI33_020720 [Rhynchophorus ferrugineus]